MDDWAFSKRKHDTSSIQEAYSPFKHGHREQSPSKN